MGNARDVNVDILGTDKTGPAFKSAAKGAGQAQSAMQRLKGSFTELKSAGEIAVRVLGMVGKVANDSIAIGLVHANARVSLGADAYGRLSEEAQKSAHSLGLTTTAYLASAGKTATLAKNMGFSADKAAELGAEFPKLANTLSILSNGTRSAAEASDMMSSALAGEFDPLQTLGINISAAIVAQEALNQKKKAGTAITDSQANALAVLAIVQRQTAQGTDVLASAEGKNATAIAEAKAQVSEMAQKIEGSLLPAIGALAKSFNEPLGGKGPGWMQDAAGWMTKLSGGTLILDAAARHLIPGLQDQQDAQSGVSVATDDAARAADSAAAAQDALTLAFQKGSEAAQTHANAILGNRDAARGYQAALDDAEATLKKNHATLDIGTEKGRANQAALDGIAEAANRQAAAILAAGGSQAEFDKSMTTSKGQLVAMGVRFGLTTAQAKAYADQVLAIPANVSTNLTITTTRLEGHPGKQADDRYSDSTFARADGGRSRTGGPAPTWNATTNVYLDGALIRHTAETVVSEALAETAFRERVGRR